LPEFRRIGAGAIFARWCGLAKVKASRGLTTAILEAAYGLTMMKFIQLATIKDFFESL